MTELESNLKKKKTEPPQPSKAVLWGRSISMAGCVRR